MQVVKLPVTKVARPKRVRENKGNKMSAEVTFTTASVIVDDAIVLACAGDELEDFARFTRISQFDMTRPPHWWKDDQDWRASSIAYFSSDREDFDGFAVLSEEGHVRYFGEQPDILEKIPGSGVYSDDAENWGYLADLQQIGEHLYACGYSGQVYKRIGPNQWTHMDAGLLQDPRAELVRLALSVINGPHENAIYAAGYLHEAYLPPRAYFWNGQEWRELKLPDVAERITNIHVESEERIWLCGSNGTLLLGNAHTGFHSQSTTNDNQLFLSVCKYRNRIYLGSNLGLFVYDPVRPAKGIQKVVTGLQPELQDANIVDSVDQVLWSIGPKDIAKFDGKTWTRIHHPDNPPIGTVPKAGKP